MLLAVDVGNTATKLALFSENKLSERFIIPTLKGKTAEELYETFNEKNIRFSDVIVCSVVPEIDSILQKLFKHFFGKDPIFVDHNTELDISINYNPPESLGADRLINAFSVLEKYGETSIICDFGTATTVDLVTKDREFLGGVIVPGIGTLSDALSIKTSKLPKVEIRKPEKLLGNSTSECIQAGIFHGYLGMIERLIVNMQSEIKEKALVITTGGWANLIAENLDLIEIVDENLTLEGLNLFFTRLIGNLPTNNIQV
ncbi:MAG: type III pantothenate kinase [Pyrinomonadaceae bacterium]|nr:type III pantothenate kinase [Pyrinomonadaceae bacterium]MCX7639529.1 type III pantothenate kinase [Pyrinomonadaceae bacterium]MDW8304420.1 type III pantothenate kinase [Acidobacteriota bacterium]